MSQCFAHSKKQGDTAENLVGDILTNAGFTCWKNHGITRKELSLWDVMASGNGMGFTIESKHDLAEARTGNVAIEYMNCRTNEPAGIIATTADFWAIILQKPPTAWIAKTEELKAYLNKTKPLKNIKGGGDGNADMVLYRRDEIFENVFSRIDHLSSGDIVNLFRNLTNVAIQEKYEAA